jgi:hypothetical protein
MKKIILLAIMILLGSCPLQADQLKIQGLSSDEEALVEVMCKNSEQVFEAVAEKYNDQGDTDPRYKDNPENTRPHITSQEVAELILKAARAYQKGEPQMEKFWAGVTRILPIEAPLEAKIAAMERIAECYLSPEAGPKTK